MSDVHADEWLTIAAQDLCEYPADIIERACAAARREITDHRALVPFIARECADMLASRRRVMRPQPVRNPLPPPPAYEPAPTRLMSHDELQALPSHLVAIGKAGGWLDEAEDGTIFWTETDEESAA